MMTFCKFRVVCHVLNKLRKEQSCSCHREGTTSIERPHAFWYHSANVQASVTCAFMTTHLGFQSWGAEMLEMLKQAYGNEAMSQVKYSLSGTCASNMADHYWR